VKEIESGKGKRVINFGGLGVGTQNPELFYADHPHRERFDRVVCTTSPTRAGTVVRYPRISMLRSPKQGL